MNGVTTLKWPIPPSSWCTIVCVSIAAKLHQTSWQSSDYNSLYLFRKLNKKFLKTVERLKFKQVAGYSLIAVLKCSFLSTFHYQYLEIIPSWFSNHLSCVVVKLQIFHRVFLTLSGPLVFSLKRENSELPHNRTKIASCVLETPSLRDFCSSILGSLLLHMYKANHSGKSWPVMYSKRYLP